MKNVQKGLIQAQVLPYVIPVLQVDILPQVHQHAMSVLQEQNLIVKNPVVMIADQEHFHQLGPLHVHFVPPVPILTNVHLNVFHALKDINQIKKVLLFVKNAHLELIPFLVRLNALIAQKEHFQEKDLPIAKRVKKEKL